MSKNWLEWLVFGVSSVLLTVVVAWLLYDGFTPKLNRPELVVNLGEPQPLKQGYGVPVRIRNEGDVTAEGVEVEVLLTPADGDEETRSITFQFVPRGSDRNGWVVFDTDPNQASSLRASVTGYEEP